jgi:hypothetical protein
MSQRIKGVSYRGFLRVKDNLFRISLLSILALIGVTLFFIPFSDSSANPLLQASPTPPVLHNEELAPATVPIAQGSGVIAAGTGLWGGTGILAPGDVEVTVPKDADIQQVLLYWAGRDGDPNSTADPQEPPDQSTINVNGTDVTGNKIASAFLDGPDDIVVTYRADITSLDLVSQGQNTLTISGGPFASFIHSGAGVVVIVDDGAGSAQIEVRDGVDSAFVNASTPPQQVTVPQTFSFAPEDFDRVAEVTVFVAQVSERTDGDPNNFRRSKILAEVNGTLLEFPNVLHSHDGLVWDTYTLTLDIPAGVSSLTVWLESDAVAPIPVGYVSSAPSAFQWIAAILDLPLEDSSPTVTPTPEGPPSTPTPISPPVVLQGCGPDFWHMNGDENLWVGYQPSDSFVDIFGVDARDVTLIEALEGKGGGPRAERAIKRHSVAALLNARHPEVSFAFTEDAIIEYVQEAFANDRWFEEVAEGLAAENTRNCPIKGNGNKDEDEDKNRDKDRERDRGRDGDEDEDDRDEDKGKDKDKDKDENKGEDSED